jgi:hypothetical protein
MRLCGFLTLICYLVAWTASLGHVHLDGVTHGHIDDKSAVAGVEGCHHHHCHAGHHHDDHGMSPASSESGEKSAPAPHHHHDGENCQLCHHLVHVAVTMMSVELVSLDAPCLSVPELTAEIYACFVASSPAPRGPPVA